MRLIDADAMRQDWLENGEKEKVYDSNAMLKSIDAQPTIDAAPVVYGWWEYDSYGNLYCSECGEIPDCFEPNFCPNCGANMMKSNGGHIR